MTASSATAGALFARRMLYFVNMALAVLGGLSLVLAVAAPFGMGMSNWASFAEVVVAACVLGLPPLLCVASIVCSRWLFDRGVESMALAVAFAPLPPLLASMAWILSNG